ncbi:MAG: DUF2177 family protein [Bdellovibrionaceae bacterium]|nr:DUF2177 family protein [Pseudobdellovibrionaceae bacterium]
MFPQLKIALIAIVLFAVIDFIWLGYITRDFYGTQLAEIGRFQDGRIKPVMWAAVLVYFLMTFALVFFAMPMVASETSWVTIFLKGAALGFVIYGIYDLTNYATLEKFPLKLLFADWAWGTVLFGSVTVLTQWISSRWS